MINTYDRTGKLVESREETAEELAIEAARAQRQALRQSVRAIITDLKAEQDRADEVLASTAATGNEKKLARAVKRTAAASIDLARLLLA